jgi:CubicO group peptidase (beta-lactamase class C family)
MVCTLMLLSALQATGYPQLPARARAAEATPIDRLTLDSGIERAMGQSRVPGLQLAILASDAIIYSRGFGYADLEAKRPMTTHTVLRAGSISKLITATLIMQHVEHARINLDDDVNRYLPGPQRIHDPSGAEVRVTVRQLLSHRSGLPPLGAGLNWLSFAAVFVGFQPPPSFEQYLAQGLTLRRSPGTELRYSNDAFILLGWLAARLAGAEFADYARRAVLDPLNMHSSDFRPDAAPLRAEKAAVYHRTASGFQPAVEYAGVWPSGSLHTTAEDLLQFARMVLDQGTVGSRKVLAPSTLAEMTRLQAVPVEGAASGFGLGFRLTRYRGQQLICHEGGNPGIAARLCLVPDRQIAVAALINADDEDFVYVLTNRVLDRLINLPEPAKHETALPPPAGWERIVGTYRTVDMAPDQLSLVEAYSQFPIEEEGGRLTLAIAKGRHFTLEPAGDPSTFVLHGGQGDGETLRFKEEEDGRLHGYASVLHIEQVRAWERTWVLGMGLAAGVTVLGAAATVHLRARRRASAPPGPSPSKRLSSHVYGKKWSHVDSNHGPPACEAGALTS